jgi:hypothetical protein
MYEMNINNEKYNKVLSLAQHDRIVAIDKGFLQFYCNQVVFALILFTYLPESQI